jgi:hypothetical protein
MAVKKKKPKRSKVKTKVKARPATRGKGKVTSVVPESVLSPTTTLSIIEITKRSVPAPADAVVRNAPIQFIDVNTSQISTFRTYDRSYHSSPRYLVIEFAFLRKGIHHGANFFELNEPVDFQIWASNPKSWFGWSQHDQIPHEPSGGNGIQTRWQRIKGWAREEVLWFPQPVTFEPVAFGLFLRVIRNGQPYIVRFNPKGAVGHLPNCGVAWAPIELHNQRLWYGPYGRKPKK